MASINETNRSKRRRIDDDNDNDDDEEEEDDDVSSPISASPLNDSRQARLERRAAERRARAAAASSQQQQQHDDNNEPPLFPGDNHYQGAVENDTEPVPDDELYVEEEEEDGEDLLDNAERDYQRIAALDTYGTEGLDDAEYEEMDIDERRAVEQVLAKRDEEQGKSRNDGFYGMLDEYEQEEDEDARKERRKRWEREQEEEEEESDDDLEAEDQVNLEAFDVPLREWIAQNRTRKEIQRKFRIFLKNFQENDTSSRRRGNGMYETKIRQMCAANLASLQVSYMHLMEAEPVLAVWVVDAPKDMLDVLNEAATRHALMLFPAYGAIQKEIHVRITHVPIVDSLRDLRRSHLDCLVQIHGVVTRRGTVSPQLQTAHYQCMSCKGTQGPFRVQGGDVGKPDDCPFCEGSGVQLKLHPTLSEYRNFQRVNLQETPGSVPPGRVPRQKEIILTNDLIDVARPGEEVEVTGIYEHSYDAQMTIKSGFPVFSTFITANHVQKKEDASSSSSLTEADLAKIMELSRDPKIGERIVQSMAPSIFGHDNCKMALAMALFGGVPKNINDKHRIRGDCNVLLLGDPGTAKSQLLKYAEYTAPRAVYSTGKGASAVGLTASVHKDPLTKEWTLEGGALVLADRGVCLIDEFDKMNEQDRTSIHEAMEQQSISVSKAGIVTSLQARCAVIAAANPIGGRYDSANTLAENVELTDPILQRFDILCVLQDVVDPVADERLAKFVTSSHMRSTPTSELRRETARQSSSVATQQTTSPDLIPQDLLRKYIQYARTHVKPVLRGNAFDQEKIASLYVQLRKESAASGGVPIAVRHVESIMRMAEAHAKMHLRDYVRDDDMDASIHMMLESFLAAQKFSVRRSLRKSFSKFLRTGDDRAHLLLHMLQEMFRNEQMYQVIRMKEKGGEIENLKVPLDELESRARERRIYDVSGFCKSEAFQEAGYVLDERKRVIVRSYESTSN